jgi:hypothetical protein
LRVAAVEEWSTQVKEVRCECDEGEGLSIGPPPIFKGVEAEHCSADGGSTTPRTRRQRR